MLKPRIRYQAGRSGRLRSGLAVFFHVIPPAALLVEFNEAAGTSLELLIVALFTGAGAEDYRAIRRFLQRTAVSACNQHGRTIPFDQSTVHMAPASGQRPD